MNRYDRYGNARSSVASDIIGDIGGNLTSILGGYLGGKLQQQQDARREELYQRHAKEKLAAGNTSANALARSLNISEPTGWNEMAPQQKYAFMQNAQQESELAKNVESADRFANEIGYPDLAGNNFDTQQVRAIADQRASRDKAVTKEIQDKYELIKESLLDENFLPKDIDKYFNYGKINPSKINIDDFKAKTLKRGYTEELRSLAWYKANKSKENLHLAEDDNGRFAIKDIENNNVMPISDGAALVLSEIPISSNRNDPVFEFFRGQAKKRLSANESFRNALPEDRGKKVVKLARRYASDFGYEFRKQKKLPKAKMNSRKVPPITSIPSISNMFSTNNQERNMSGGLNFLNRG